MNSCHCLTKSHRTINTLNITMGRKKSDNLTKEEKLAYATIGRRGGLATVEKHGKNYMSELGKKGMEKRWQKSKISE